MLCYFYTDDDDWSEQRLDFIGELKHSLPIFVPSSLSEHLLIKWSVPPIKGGDDVAEGEMSA